jgi:hypothetical protein
MAVVEQLGEIDGWSQSTCRRHPLWDKQVSSN